MKPWRFVLLALAPLAAFRAQADPPTQPAERPAAIAKFEDEVIRLADAARPWLVRISCNYKGDEKGADAFFSSDFSGVVLSVEKGQVYVVTVGTAVRGAKKVEVAAPDGNDCNAEIVGVDEVTNLAVIRFDPGEAQFTAATFGDSDAARAGSFVLALGNPFGLSGSVSNGIVSGVKRTVNGSIQPLTGMLQITAPINPGDSGGLLLNSRGEVVGILSSTFQRATAYDADIEEQFRKWFKEIDWAELLKKFQAANQDQAIAPKDLQEWVQKLLDERKKVAKSGRGAWMSQQQLGAEGINFAIPSNLALKIASALKANGKVERGYLGIRVFPPDNALRKHLNIPAGRGLVVLTIEAGSPAADAGLRLYDVITQLDGKDLSDVSSLADAIGGHRQGDSVTIRVRRGQEDLELKATLGKK